MTDVLHSSPPHLSSTSSSITRVLPTNNDGFHQQAFLNNESLINGRPVALYRRNNGIQGQQEVEQEGEGDQFSVLEVLVSVFRKSLVGCRSTAAESGGVERLMEIGWPTNVRHVAHVTFDRFNGFLGLPVEFEPEVPRRPPSASTRVFGVSTESMQLSFDSRGNCVPTILLMMQRRLYCQGGLQAEGIFRINAENGQEEYVREQLNNGEVPDNIDVHCLAGLIKAWFRELPQGVLDPLSPEQVMQAQSEDECTQLVRLLPPTEAALLDWAINLMADVAQLEHLNKMSARNIAMVFAPNMTQMLDPLTALMYAVQVMNFLKTLIEKTLREREDSVVDVARVKQIEPSDEDDHQGTEEAIIWKAVEVSEDDQDNVANEPLSNDAENSSRGEFNSTSNETHCFLSSIENILPDGKEHTAGTCPSNITNHVDSTKDRVGGDHTSVRSRQSQSKSQRTKKGQPSKNGAKKVIQPSVVHVSENSEKSKEKSITSLLNSQTERVEAWR
ncbi:rho GTPase-activating protein 5-like [Forsythia ovata]|uniref:Rho GTPase-activating protein 5-like n=1 Tax=Forsythia ovata TaxID=205694 RepID=A0ABD1WX10_9LAMI